MQRRLAQWPFLNFIYFGSVWWFAKYEQLINKILQTSRNLILSHFMDLFSQDLIMKQKNIVYGRGWRIVMLHTHSFFTSCSVCKLIQFKIYIFFSFKVFYWLYQQYCEENHSLIDEHLLNENWSLIFFQIDDLLQRSKIPIVVGGTNYYIESLLWHNLVSPGIGKRKRNDSVCGDLSGLSYEVREFIENSLMVEKMEEMESAKLYEYLQRIDPPMANRLHPNNKRKIMRWVAPIFKIGN